MSSSLLKCISLSSSQFTVIMIVDYAFAVFFVPFLPIFIFISLSIAFSFCSLVNKKRYYHHYSMASNVHKNLYSNIQRNLCRKKKEEKNAIFFIQIKQWKGDSNAITKETKKKIVETAVIRCGKVEKKLHWERFL